jgi:hypothetical protein
VRPVGGKRAEPCRRQGRSGLDLAGGGDVQGWAAEIHPFVDWEVWREEVEGLELGEDEGWADDNRGLRCAECAEGVYCGEGGEKKGGVDGDEILAAFQEDFEAVLCAAKDETSVDIMGRTFCCNFLRKSQL